MTSTTAPGRLFLVRHGETAWTRTGQHTGRTDLPLEPEGRAQAEAVGRRLAGRPFALVLVSPLVRARETCELAGYGDVAQVDDDLREWDYGDYEGRTTEEVRVGRPGWTIWRDGAPGGETPDDVGQRADRIVARVRGTVGDSLCVAHGHLLRVLAARWLGLPPVGGQLLALDPGSLSVLDWARHEQPLIGRWNEGSPLPPPA